MKSFILKFTILLIPILCGIGFFSINGVNDNSNIYITTVSDFFDEFDTQVNDSICRVRCGASLRVENDEDIEDCSLASCGFYSQVLGIKFSFSRISLSTNKQYFFTRTLPTRAGPVSSRLFFMELFNQSLTC